MDLLRATEFLSIDTITVTPLSRTFPAPRPRPFSHRRGPLTGWEAVMFGQSSAAPSAMSFASLLRQLRTEARLTQEELAQKAGLSPRSISDLERGISRTARRQTADLLADALAIGGSVRTAFLATARGRAPALDVFTVRDHTHADAPVAPILSSAGTHEALGLHEARVVGRVIDALATVGAGEGRPVAVILLVGL